MTLSLGGLVNNMVEINCGKWCYMLLTLPIVIGLVIMFGCFFKTIRNIARLKQVNKQQEERIKKLEERKRNKRQQINEIKQTTQELGKRIDYLKKKIK